MSYQEYFEHYIQFPYFPIFTLITVLLLLIIYAIFFCFAWKTQKGSKAKAQEFFSLSERLYELIFSGGSIIGFMAVYYLINRFVTAGPFKVFWDNYKDYLLLLFMVLFILFNTIWDHFVVRLKHLDRPQLASIRLTGMVYMIIIFGYIKFIYQDNNYDMFITYFLTLMIGRFVYFDASFKDFLENAKGAAKNIPIMFIGLIYLGILCAYGYSQSYLLKHNGVITNIFFTHILISVVITCLQWVPGFIVKKLLRKKKMSTIDHVQRDV